MPRKPTPTEASAPVWKGNEDLSPLLRAIADMDEDPRNIRIHPDTNISAIKASYTEFGQTKPIVIWRPEPEARPIVLAGNGTLRSLRELGWTHLAVSEYKGSEVKARAYAAADNQIPLLAEWSENAGEELTWITQALEAESIDWKLADIGFVVEPLAEEETPRPNTKRADGKINREREREKTEEGEDVDGDEIAEAARQIQAGDLFQLGAHRLICGDSTDSATLARLMGGERAAFGHADPPYGLNKEGVTNDDLHGDRLDAFQLAWWKACRPFIVDNGSAFVWGAAPDLWRFWYKHLAPRPPTAEEAAAGIVREPLSIREEIVWDKGDGPGMCSDEMRSWASTTERAIFFMFGEQKFNTNSENFWPGWEPLRAALAGEIERAGWANKEIHAITGTHMFKHWFTRSQWTFITEPHYLKLQAAGVDKGVFQFEYSVIREVYERAKAEHDAEVKAAFYAGRSFFDNTHDTMGEVWSFPRVLGEERYGHSTPKPVALIVRAIKSCCPSGGIVLEPFIGSGSTLIAAEECGRRCFGVEIKAEYVAKTIARFEKRTGQKAEKLS